MTFDINGRCEYCQMLKDDCSCNLKCQFCDKLLCPECNDCSNDRCFESYHCKCLEDEEEEDQCSCRDGEINPYCRWCFG